MWSQALALLSRTSWPGGGAQTGKCEFTPVLWHVTAMRLSPFQPVGIHQTRLSVHSSCVHTHPPTHTPTHIHPWRCWNSHLYIQAIPIWSFRYSQRPSTSGGWSCLKVLQVVHLQVFGASGGHHSSYSSSSSRYKFALPLIPRETFSDASGGPWPSPPLTEMAVSDFIKVRGPALNQKSKLLSVGNFMKFQPADLKGNSPCSRTHLVAAGCNCRLRCLCSIALPEIILEIIGWAGRHWLPEGLHTGGGFSGGSAGKESTCNVGNLGSIPVLGRSPGEGKGYPLQYSGLENSMGYTVPKSHVPTQRVLSQRVGHDWVTFTPRWEAWYSKLNLLLCSLFQQGPWAPFPRVHVPLLPTKAHKYTTSQSVCRFNPKGLLHIL